MIEYPLCLFQDVQQGQSIMVFLVYIVPLKSELLNLFCVCWYVQERI